MSNTAQRPDQPGSDTEQATADSDHDTPPAERTPVTHQQFEERLRAVERALTGSDVTVAAVSDDMADAAAATTERAALESEIGDLGARVAELEAATQALRGYVGSIRAVNRDVERRADLALARASNGQHNDPPHPTDPDDGGSGALSETALDAAVPDGSPEHPTDTAEGSGAVNTHNDSVNVHDDTINSHNDSIGNKDAIGNNDSIDNGHRDSNETDPRSSEAKREGSEDESWSKSAIDRLRESV